MSYTAEVSRRNPTCFLFLIDQSGSMNASIPGDAVNSKAQFVATAINRVLQELVIRCSKDMSIYRYFQVGVIGYGVNVGSVLSGNLTGQSLAWIDDLYQNPLRVEEIKKKVSDGAGGLVEVAVKFPVWFDAVASGGTPMVQAFQQAYTILQNWVTHHPTSFPPIVINITDGASTDGDPSSLAALLKSLSTNDGNVLLLNLHVSSAHMKPLTFPETLDTVLDQYAHLLFGMSSSLPSIMQEAAAKRGYQISDRSRGFVFNAGIEDVIHFLEIGSRVSTELPDEQ